MKEDVLEKTNDVINEGLEGYNSSIDNEDMGHVLHILSSSLYSSPIKSLVRELCTNAWDSHIEAKVDKPIEVGIKKDSEGKQYFYVRDFGTGLSPERIRDVYSKFGKSTKRNTDDQHGFFGIGKFSPLSYTDLFYIDTIYNGVQYNYIMHKGESIIRLDKLNEFETNEGNGTTVKVYFNTDGYYENQNFELAIKEQLAYFKNVVVNIKNFNNDYKLYEGKTFISNSLNTHGNLHVCLGQVYYPIDFNILGIFTINIPVALKFDIGSLSITPNRESLKYNDKTIKAIKDKLREFADELVDFYNSKSDKYTDIFEYFNSFKYGYKIYIGEKNVNITKLASDFSRKNIIRSIFEPLKDLDLSILSESHLFSRFTCNYRLNQTGRVIHLTYNNGVSSLLQNYSDCCLRISGETNSKKNKFIIDTKIVETPAYFIRNNGKVTLKFYKSILNLKWKDKENWRKKIKIFQDWEDSVYNSIKSYEDIEITEDWLNAQKAGKQTKANLVSIRKSEGKIIIKFPDRYNSWRDYSYKQKDILIKDLPNQKRLIIYGCDDDKEKLQKVQLMLKGIKAITVISAKYNHHYFMLLSNFIHVDKFLKGNNQILKRFVTAVEMRDILEKANLDDIKVIDKSFYDRLCELNKYVYNFRGEDNLNNNDNREFVNQLIQQAKDKNLFDYRWYALKEQLEKKIKFFDFTKLFHISLYVTNQFALKLGIELLKYRKYRLPYKWYNKNIFNKEIK